MAARGVNLLGQVRVLRDQDPSPLAAAGPPTAATRAPKILARHDSPPLREILRVVNKESHNLFAEAVLRTLGRVVRGDGSFEGGSRVVEEFLVREVGIPPEEVRVRDGSGLSPANAVSAGGLVQLLAYMSGSPHWGELWETLPEAGVRRELSRMSRSPAAGNLRAKTGTMKGVSALSGQVRTRSGERILFSILSNEVASEYRAKRAEDQLGIRLASFTRQLQD